MAGFSNKLTEAWAVDDYYVEINGCELHVNDIVDYEAVFGGECINAVITFIDTLGFAPGSPQGSASLAVGGFVDIGYVSAGSCEFEAEYVIKKIHQRVDKQNKRLITLELMDVNTAKMKSSFVNKGYPNQKYSSALESHLEELSVTGIDIITTTSESIVNAVIPASMSFYDHIVAETKEKGMKVIRDKSVGYVVPQEQMTQDKLVQTNEEFEYDTSNIHSFWRILQYNVEGFNMDSLLASIPTKETSITSVNSASNANTNKGISGETQEKETTSTKTLAGTSIKDNVTYQGQKLANVQTPGSGEYFKAIESAQKASIWVPGMNYDRVGKKIIVNFPKPTYVNNDEYDEVLSGEWEIYLVRDKIIKEFFIQELFIRRAGV